MRRHRQPGLPHDRRKAPKTACRDATPSERGCWRHRADRPGDASGEQGDQCQADRCGMANATDAPSRHGIEGRGALPSRSPTRSCRRAIPYLPSTVTPESGGTERVSNVASRFCLAEHGVDLRRLQSEVRAGGGGDRSTGGPGAIPLASGSRPAPRPDGGRLAGTGGVPANADLARNRSGHGRLDPPA